MATETTFKIAARYMPAKPKPLYKDGVEILPNPTRHYKVDWTTDFAGSEVLCVENPHQPIDWKLYNHDGKSYCKREDSAFWPICDLREAVCESLQLQVQPQQPVVCASRKKRIVAKAAVAFKVKMDKVTAFLGIGRGR